MLDKICKTLNLDSEDFEEDKDGCYIYEIETSNEYARIQSLLDKNYEEDYSRGLKTFESSVDVYYLEDWVLQLNADMENNLFKLIIKKGSNE